MNADSHGVVYSCFDTISGKHMIAKVLFLKHEFIAESRIV